jgi:uncharacterized repeat protein (TIGR04052 family)
MKHSRRTTCTSRLLLLLAFVLAAGCGESASGDEDAATDAAHAADHADLADAGSDAAVVDSGASLDAANDGDTTPDAGDRTFEIAFRGVLGDETVACGTEYAGFGPTADQTVTIKDFRFYVHGVSLVRSDDVAVPLTLVDEAPFQRAGVALLDFEDKSADCVNGTEATRTVVRGTAPEGDYVGLRFVLGVPLDQNHQDRSIALAPLDLTQLFWSWAGGYVFARVDVLTVPGDDAGVPMNFNVHLGSTGCNGTPSTTPSTTCAYENRPTITLMGFDPDTDVVLVDPKAVLAGVDLTVNTPATAIGCMSGRADPECALVMPRLGLDFGETVGMQTLFRTAP